uniref:Putative conserved plasma membrane protein n=1 Tax=Panstrongylus lignarius TaxID=156445 RepID=A0A224XB66_9HEMI
MCFLTKFYLALKIGFSMVPLLVFSTIVLILIPANSLVSAVLHPPGSHPTTICDLPQCSCDQKVYCRCDAMQTIVLRSHGFEPLPERTGSINIEKCSKVVITKGAILRMKALRKINLENIAHLEMEEEAFKWDTSKIQEVYTPGIGIRIVNTTIQMIPSDAFQGHITSILFENVSIANIRALAFSNLAGTEKIEFKNCDIDSIEPQSFKKFILDSFIINGGNVDIMPSYSLIGITIKKDLKLENVHFGYIRSSAFRVEDPKIFKLQNCIVENLEGEAFRVVTRGPVFIDDNVLPRVSYGAFAGITLDSRYLSWSGPQDLLFENNTLQLFADYALSFNTTGFVPKIDRIVLDKPCTCNDIKLWTDRLVKYSDGSRPVDLTRLMWCTKDARKNIDSVVSDFQRRHCAHTVAQVYWIVSVLIITLIVLIALCSLGFYLFRRHARRYMNVPTNDSAQNRLSVHSTHNNHVVIIPESKTYRETELHIIEERLEPIKEYVPPQAVTQPI